MDIIDVLKPVFDLKLPGNLIYAKVWGSRSHNTELPDSDTDFLAVYTAPTDAVLGLDEPPDTMDTEKPDIQAHEAKKFCRLLLKGNPGILEMLWTERMTYETSEWLELKEHRRSFLSCEAVRQYLGYAQGQLRKLSAHGGKGGLHTKGGEYNEKWAYHMVRLLWDARRIATGREPLVWKETGDIEHASLMDIRSGKPSREMVEKIAKELINEIEMEKPWKLPEYGDKHYLNHWLLDLRHKVI